MVKVKGEIKKLKSRILPVLKKHDVVRAGIFGSYARGEQKRNSDVDVLIQFKGRKSLLDLSGLKIELEEKLKKEVHLVTYKYIHPGLKSQVLKEEVKLL